MTDRLWGEKLLKCHLLGTAPFTSPALSSVIDTEYGHNGTRRADETPSLELARAGSEFGSGSLFSGFRGRAIWLGMARNWLGIGSEWLGLKINYDRNQGVMNIQ